MRRANVDVRSRCKHHGDSWRQHERWLCAQTRTASGVKAREHSTHNVHVHTQLARDAKVTACLAVHADDGSALDCGEVSRIDRSRTASDNRSSSLRDICEDVHSSDVNGAVM
jgi:hypothetical protein